MSYSIIIAAFFVIIAILTSIKIFREYERGVIFRLGKFVGVRGPGLVFIIPFGIERSVKVSLRAVVKDVTPQDVITSDNVSVNVNAVLSFRVVAPKKAIIEVEEYQFAIDQVAQTALRSVLGSAELDDLLMERERLNAELEKIVAFHSEPWGIEVLAMEIKDVDLPEEMRRAMAKQAEAERERRAKVINAEGELEAAEDMIEAAKILSSDPIAIQLRYLHSLTEIATEKESTLVFPLPINLTTSFLRSNVKDKQNRDSWVSKERRPQGVCHIHR